MSAVERAAAYIKYHFSRVKDPEGLAQALQDVASSGGIDLMTELAKAKAYVAYSGKSYRNHSRFLVNWVNRVTGSHTGDKWNKFKDKWHDQQE